MSSQLDAAPAEFENAPGLLLRPPAPRAPGQRPTPNLLRRIVNRRLLWVIAKYGFGIGVLAWVLWANWDPGGNAVGLKGMLQRPMHFGFLAAGILICTASLLLTFVRWYYLVRAQDLPFTLRDAIRLGMVGFFMSTFLPGVIGGDVVKAAVLVREQSRRTVAVATVAFDRILGLVGLFWLAALLGAVFWLTGDLRGQAVLLSIIAGAWAVCGSLLLGWFVLGLLRTPRADALAARLERLPKVGGPLAELWRAAWLYRRRGRSVWLALGLAILGHVGFVITFYFGSLTLSPAESIPSLKEHYLIVPVGMLIQAGFPAPGGMGGGEFAFGKLYEVIGKVFESGVLASLIYRVISWILGLAGYMVYLRMGPSLALPRAEPQPET
ncbi:MAG TPA: lysylphosphatidylglycerol synthase transmembrane domain-containing protein [Terriglobia bacterium]|nr:lysylphosphatidylglycerol synthase transmembrane domain-containing protein [Terriglobia bacterium]